MDMIVTVISNIFIMFAFILIGFTLRRKGILSGESTAGITFILLKIAIPATIITATTSQPFDTARLGNMGIMLGMTVLFFVVFTVIGWWIAKLLRLPANRQGVFAISATFSNVAFMGIPIISAIWGNAGVFYLSLVNIPFFVGLSIASSLLLREERWHAVGVSAQKPRKKFKLELNIAISILGLLLYLSQDIIPVPVLHFIRPTVIDGVGGGVLGRLITQLHQLTTPISMFVIGSSLGDSKLSDTPKDLSIFAMLGVSLLLFPLIAFFSTGFITDETLRGVLVLKTAMPTATLVAIFAEQRKADGLFASQLVFLSTVVSLLTIPLISLLLG